jgi:hypothetical protein
MHLIAASLAEIKYEERIEIDKSIYHTSTINLSTQLNMLGFPPQTKHAAKYAWLSTTNNEIIKYHLLA